ncbi:MAG: hypothetical protein QM768_21810 [Agriterribacter sp.]
MAFTTLECDWSQVSMKILKSTIVGLRAFSFDFEIDKEHLFAAGSKPISIQSGNEKPTGSLKLLKFEIDKLNDAAQVAGFKTILHVPYELVSITCAFKRTVGAPMYIIDALGVGFQKLGVAMEQGAKFSESDVPFLAMDFLLRRGQ